MTQVDFYDKEQVDDLLAAKADDSKVESIATDVGTSADVPSATGSIWARLKYILTHWMTTDSEQTVSAKKIFSVSPEVPTTPATPTSAVNSVHVNDPTPGVNNILHKSNNETKSGQLTVEYSGSRQSCMLIKSTSLALPVDSIGDSTTLGFLDANDTFIGAVYIRAKPDGTTALMCTVLNSDGTTTRTQLATGSVI